MEKGDVFGSLIAVNNLYTNKRRECVWEFMCICGNSYQGVAAVIKRQAKIIDNPDVPSCGCVNKRVAARLATKHGRSGEPLYNLYFSMHQRCYNRNNARYSLYGGAGIKICEEWLSHPEVFMNWAELNGWKPGLQIDKDILCDALGIHPKIYSPLTCQFITLQCNTKYSSSRKTGRLNSKNIVVSEKDANIIRKLYSQGDKTQEALAAQYGVRQGVISYIINS